MKNKCDKIIIISRMSNTQSIVAAITTLIICCVLFFYLPQYISDNQYVRQVKGGHPYGYPNISYESAFEKFYGAPTWGYMRGNDGSNIVTFTGECQYDGKPAIIQLRFKLNADDSFSLIGGKINGTEQNLLVLSTLNSTPFEKYE